MPVEALCPCGAAWPHSQDHHGGDDDTDMGQGLRVTDGSPPASHSPGLCRGREEGWGQRGDWGGSQGQDTAAWGGAPPLWPCLTHTHPG